MATVLFRYNEILWEAADFQEVFVNGGMTRTVSSESILIYVA